MRFLINILYSKYTLPGETLAVLICSYFCIYVRSQFYFTVYTVKVCFLLKPGVYIMQNTMTVEGRGGGGLQGGKEKLSVQYIPLY